MKQTSKPSIFRTGWYQSNCNDRHEHFFVCKQGNKFPDQCPKCDYPHRLYPPPWDFIRPPTRKEADARGLAPDCHTEELPDKNNPIKDL